MAVLGALGDLVLALSADTARFQSDLGRAHRQAEKFGREVGIVMGKVAGAIFALGGSAGFGALVKGQIDAADEAGKMAQKIGIGVEALSAYMIAARLADVSNDQLKTGFQQLAKNQADFVNGTGEAANAFGALGITQAQVKALNGDTAALFELVVGKLSKFADGANKTALAIKIFGRSGAELIPLINDLENTRGEAAKLNAIIDKDTAAAAERFNDNLTRLGVVVQSLGMGVAKTLLPALEKVTARMVEGARSGEPWLAFLREELRLVLAIAEKMPYIGPAARAVGAALDSSTKSAKGFQADIRAIDNALSKPPGPLLRDLKKELEDAAKGAQAFRKALSEPVVDSAEETQRAAEELVYTWDEAGNRVEMTRDQYAKLTEQVDGMADAINRAHDDAMATIEADKEIVKQQGLVNASFVESAQLSQEAADSMVYTWDAAGNRIEMTREAFDELAAQQQKNIDFGKTLGFTFTSAFEDAVLKGGDLRDILKGLEQDIARIILRKAVSEPLANAIGGAVAAAMAGGSTSQLSAPSARAMGGPVDAGMPYLVGEQGPEIMVPGASGTVMPNGAFGGVAIYQTIHVDSRSDQASIVIAMRRAKDEAVAEVKAIQQRRGDSRIG